MVRVAVVGLGFMGKTHLGVYGKLPNVAVAALCDPRKDSVQIASREPGGNIQTKGAVIDLEGARKYYSFEEMLSVGGFDVVDLCVPTFLHAELTIQALEAGCHVFCEKPMALTIEETQRMLEKVEQTGKLFSVGQCLRFWPAYVEVKNLVDSGKFGKVRYVEFARLSAPPRWSGGNWMSDSTLSGNAALDLHIHDADMILHMFGPPQSVQSRGVFERDGSISHITTLYAYPDLLAQASGGWLCSESFGFTMRALFALEHATIELDFTKSPVVMVSPKGKDKYALPLPDGDGYYHELRDFIDGVERGRLSGIVTGRSAAEAVRLCLLEIQSATQREEKPC